MEQVRSPNINVYAELGMCLNYVQRAYNSGWAGSYALEGWNMCQFKHADWNLPANVYVPIWFSGYWDGFNYGHVAIYFNGTVYSSPWAANSAARKVHDTLGSIADVERIYGMKFIGWSEDIGNTRVIKPKENIVEQKIPDQDNYYWRFGQKTMERLRGRQQTRDEFRKTLVGLTPMRAIEVIEDDPEADRAYSWQQLGRLADKDKWQQQIADRTKERDQARTEAAKNLLERNQARDEATKYRTENVDLKAQLALQSDDTKLLNGFGEFLRKLIARLGVK